MKINPENVDPLIQSVQKSRELLIQKENQRKELSEKLANLKSQKLNLMNEVASIRVGPNQANTVEKIHQDSKLTELTIKGLKNAMMQMHLKESFIKAAKQVESNIDVLIEKQTVKM